MLSPDNFIQAPGFTQNFNRYSYVLNNPLRYTDPDGEWVVKALMTAVGMYWGGAAANNFQFNPQHWNWKNPMTYIGMAQGAVGGYFEGAAMEQDWLNFKSSRPYKFKIDKNPVFYAWGPGDPNNEFDTYVSKEAIAKGTRITKKGWMSNMWNSGVARFLVDDLISVDFHLYSTAIGGGGQTWSLNLLTRGQNPGFHLTRTNYKRIGGEIDWGFNINSARYIGGDIRKMRASSISGPAKSISLGYEIGLDIFTGYNEKGKLKWIGRGVGLGFGAGISYGWGRTYNGWW